MSPLQADFSGAIRQTAMMKQLPRAHKHITNVWGADTVRILQMSARKLQKSGGKKKGGGQLARSLSYKAGGSDEQWTVAVGTGLPGHVASKYARIQDEGGTTHPKVTKRMRRWAWFMFGSTGEDKYKAIALTKKARLDVKIPGSRWFSSVIEHREPTLTDMMQPDHVMKVAQGMAGV